MHINTYIYSVFIHIYVYVWHIYVHSCACMYTSIVLAICYDHAGYEASQYWQRLYANSVDMPRGLLLSNFILIQNATKMSTSRAAHMQREHIQGKIGWKEGRMDDMNAWKLCQSRNHRNNSLQLQQLAAATRSQAEITNTRYLILPKGKPIIRLLRLRLRFGRFCSSTLFSRDNSPAEASGHSDQQPIRKVWK